MPNFHSLWLLHTLGKARLEKLWDERVSNKGLDKSLKGKVGCAHKNVERDEFTARSNNCDSKYPGEVGAKAHAEALGAFRRFLTDLSRKLAATYDYSARRFAIHEFMETLAKFLEDNFTMISKPSLDGQYDTKDFARLLNTWKCGPYETLNEGNKASSAVE